eukprot:4473045-Amphidinium_carterae.1
MGTPALGKDAGREGKRSSHAMVRLGGVSPPCQVVWLCKLDVLSGCVWGRGAGRLPSAERPSETPFQ